MLGQPLDTLIPARFQILHRGEVGCFVQLLQRDYGRRLDDLRALPVVVLTTSTNEQDIQHMYELRCSTYIFKPLDLEAFERAIQLICEYWFGLATLPDSNEDGALPLQPPLSPDDGEPHES